MRDTGDYTSLHTDQRCTLQRGKREEHHCFLHLEYDMRQGNVAVQLLTVLTPSSPESRFAQTCSGVCLAGGAVDAGAGLVALMTPCAF